MPFVNTALVPLVTNSGFTMWLYRTTDSRAVALTEELTSRKQLSASDPAPAAPTPAARAPAASAPAAPRAQ